MKLNITKDTTAHALSEILAKASAARYTHASDGVSVVPLAKLDTSKRGEFELGVKLKGRPFELRQLAENESPNHAAPPKAEEKKPTPRKGKVIRRKPKTKAEKAAAKLGSGFIVFIDKLLTDTDGNEKVDGFVRSNYTVDEALKEVMRKFPDKNPTSVKKIIKVRPRHLERRKDGVYDDTKTRAPRWNIVGPGKNGSMTEIDALYGKGKPTSVIIEYLVKTHGRDQMRTTGVVERRIEFLEKQENKSK